MNADNGAPASGPQRKLVLRRCAWRWRPSSAHRAHEALPAALALAQQLGPRGAALAAQAQAAFVDGLGVAMLIAAGSAAAAAAFVAWRAPRKPVVAESSSPPPTTAHRPKGHEMKPVTVRVTVPEGR